VFASLIPWKLRVKKSQQASQFLIRIALLAGFLLFGVHPETSSDFDVQLSVNQVLADVGMTTDDCGGELIFTDEIQFLSPCGSG